MTVRGAREQRDMEVTVTNYANAESTRSTVRGAAPERSAAEPLIAISSQPPKACLASGSLSGAAQRRDRGATPQTGFSLGPQAAGSSLTPKQEPSPISPLPRSVFPSGVRVPATSSVGGLYPASEAFPLPGLGRPRCLSLLRIDRHGWRRDTLRCSPFPADNGASVRCGSWRHQALDAQSL